MQPTSRQEPLISLVALVRDEASDLRRLLSWHEPLYDEAVIVDTGSEDGSPGIAAALGARLTHFRWCDDFSAARNHGLQCARGRWILVLDCDEVLDPADFARVRELCAGDFAAWQFNQRNYCGRLDDPQWVPLGAADGPLVPRRAEGYVDAATCRLFPRLPGVKYEGRVHELPNRSLGRLGVPTVRAAILVHHFGHLVGPEREEIKNTRYGNLLRRKLKDHPRDPVARYELAVQLVTEGRTELARRLLARTIGEAPEHDATHRARMLLGRLLLQAGEPDAAVAQAEAAVRGWPALREGWVDVIRLHFRLGHLPEAIRYLERGRYLFPRDSVLQALDREVRQAGAGAC